MNNEQGYGLARKRHVNLVIAEVQSYIRGVVVTSVHTKKVY